MASTAEMLSLQYTAPTCTLSITGERSGLSQFADRPLLNRLRFRLDMLDAGGHPLLTLSGVRPQLLDLMVMVQGYVQTYLDPPVLEPVPPVEQGVNAPSLQPEGLTRHRFNLGALANRGDPPSVSLSTLQLADLASVFDQMDDAVGVLPSDALPRSRRWFARPTVWAGTAAAAALLVAVGVGTLLNTSTPLETTQAPDRVAVQSPDQRLENEISPVESAPPEQPESTADSAESETLTPPRAGGAPSPTAAPTERPSTLAPESRPTPPAAPPTATVPPTAAPQPAAPTPQPEALPTPAETAQAEAEAAADQEATARAPAPTPAARGAARESAPQTMSAPEPTGAGVPDDSAVAPTAEIDPGVAALSASPLDIWLADAQQQLQQQWVPIDSLSVPVSYLIALSGTGELVSVVPQTALSEAVQPQIRWLTEDRIHFPPPPEGSGPFRLILYPSGQVEILELSTGMP